MFCLRRIRAIMGSPKRRPAGIIAMKFRSIKTILFLIGCSYALSALAADSITGKVMNQTTKQPAAGNEVVLLRLENGMEEEAKTHTDAQGRFVLPLPAPASAQHIVRVIHQQVNYDQTVRSKEPLEIAVYDAVPRIPHLQGSIGMAQVESDGQMLKITEMYAITNDSRPPVTQAGPSNFEVSIAPEATLDSFMVRKGGGVWVNVAPAPVTGQQGHYVVDFPMRPGETFFKFIYHLPYLQPTTVRIKPAYPVAKFAVMHPPAMTFKSSNPQAFTSPGEARGLRVEQAVSNPVVRDVPAFEISGIGSASSADQAKRSSPAVGSSGGAAPNAAGSSSPAAQPVTSVRPETGMWALASGIAALLAASVYMVWKKRKKQASRP